MTKVYITSQGDMWDSIAYKQMGNEKYMHLLVQSNPQYREIVVFPANLSLNIPEISIPIANCLPPWKRSKR